MSSDLKNPAAVKPAAWLVGACLLAVTVVLGAVALHAWLQTRDTPQVPASVSRDTAPILPSQARSKP
jgi:hypothetical protein